MTRYLVDTNHLSACLNPVSHLRQRIRTLHRQGSNFGVCVPILCELEAGLVGYVHSSRSRRALRDMLGHELRIWPIESDLAPLYGQVFSELRRRGRVLSQVDMMAAAMCRQMKLTLLSTDRDFDSLPDLRCENWSTSGS